MFRDIIDNVFAPRLTQRVTYTLAAGLCGLLLAPAAWSASLAISDSPLFLSSGVRPNVFFQLDDSGSMDWEILTVKHWSFCDYDPTSRIDTYTFDADTCDGTIRSDGLWQSHTQLGGNTGGSTETFEYIYVNSDAAYSQNCSSSRETMYACNGTLTANIPYLNDWRILSSDFNVLYYDPDETYIPWLGPCTGDTATPTPAVPCANASFTAARSNPRNGTAGYTVTRDLDGFAWEEWTDDRGFDPVTISGVTRTRPYRGSRNNANTTPNNIVDLWDKHTRYQISGNDIIITTTTYAPAQVTGFPPATSGLNPTSSSVTLSGTGCFPLLAGDGLSCRTITQVKQNVANWYQYARKRQYVAKAGVSAVIDQVPSFRYGLDTINQFSGFVEVPTGLGNYTAHNDSVLDTLYSFAWPAQGTPLRQGLQRAGDYFDKDGANNLGRTNPIEYSCQKNFNVLLTDGFWNGNSPGIGDIDNDGISNTVADVARNYYDHDLDVNMSNDVEPDAFDPEVYQHVVTYTLAFGVEGQLVDSDPPGTTVGNPAVFGQGSGWPNPPLAENGNWGNPTCTDGTCNPDKIDDLWHAAYNSRGTYISAATPASVVTGLQDAIKNAQFRTGSASSVALNSGVVNTNTRIYQARFIDTDWRGELLAIPVLTDGTPDLLNAVDAGLAIQSPGSRVMMTHDGSSGVLFEGASLSAAQLGILNTDALGNTDTLGPARLAWLRGDQAQEIQNGGFFRNRPSSILADIINSAPVFVGKPEARYPDVWTGGALAQENCGALCEAYSTFKANKAGRTPMVYVGTNGGTLNGFNADFTASPVEKLAYVPGKVFPTLTQLMDPGYTHNYYVDGSPTVVDAFFASDKKWHTVLAGGLNKGGQGIYALDVTDPANFAATATSAQNTVLWEFTDANDADLGFSYSRPAIVRMHNGRWAAVFGNGYNNRDNDGNQSTTGHAVLFIVDIETGSLIRKIDTEVGSTTTPNGLATPAVVDINGDFTAEFIYAGDLQGNLWKFDVTDIDPANWDVAFRDVSNVPEPFYIAEDSSGNRQPITVRPEVGRGPDGIDAMVYFGTGIYLQNADLANTSVQTFYGILDDGTRLTGRNTSVLAPQMVIYQGAFSGIPVRATSNNGAGSRGWLMDLPDTGERSVSIPILRAGRIIFVTIIPDSNVCNSGGISWLMELDGLTGSRLAESPFDLDGDGNFTIADYVTVVVNYDINKDGVIDSNDTDNVPVSGKGFGALVPTPGILSNVNTEFKYTPNSAGGLEVTRENPGPTAVGRQSWGQLR